jgi:hypothetical protein
MKRRIATIALTIITLVLVIAFICSTKQMFGVSTLQSGSTQTEGTQR